MRLPFLSLVHSVAPLQRARVGGETAIILCLRPIFSNAISNEGCVSRSKQKPTQEWDQLNKV